MKQVAQNVAGVSKSPPGEAGAQPRAAEATRAAQAIQVAVQGARAWQTRQREPSQAQAEAESRNLLGALGGVV